MVNPVILSTDEAAAVVICHRGPLPQLVQLSMMTVLSVAVHAEVNVGGSPQCVLMVVEP